MDFVGGLQFSSRGNDYLYAVVYMFSKMCILTPCKNKNIAEQTTHLFFQNIWIHFGLPTSIVSDKILDLLGIFGQICGT